jgi:hypothetical protein
VTLWEHLVGLARLEVLQLPRVAAESNSVAGKVRDPAEASDWAEEKALEEAAGPAQ